VERQTTVNLEEADDGRDVAQKGKLMHVFVHFEA
jgi:hypothetical protein